MPPDFCAKAGPTSTAASAAATVTARIACVMTLPPSLLPLFVEPDVLHPRAVEGAVDHDREVFDGGLPAGAAAVVKDHRPSAVRGQLPFDLPDDLPALGRVAGDDRLAIDQRVDLGAAIADIVQIAAAAVNVVEALIGIGAGARSEEHTSELQSQS